LLRDRPIDGPWLRLPVRVAQASSYRWSRPHPLPRRAKSAAEILGRLAIAT
jgi:hypothetical protein